MPEDWFNGNKYTPFTVMMRLERIDETTFKSTYPAYSPGGSTRAFGGHVFAQSAWAAAQVVKKGFIIHVRENFLIFSFGVQDFLYIYTPTSVLSANDQFESSFLTNIFPLECYRLLYPPSIFVETICLQRANAT